MADADADIELIRRAVAGDEVAIQHLLWAHYEPLRQYIHAQLSPRNRSRISAEDVMQDVMQDVFREIHHLSPEGTKELTNWLRTIAKRKMLNAIRNVNAIKRGGTHVHVSLGANGNMTTGTGALPQGSDRTPSRSLERNEAVIAVRQTVAELASDQRDAVRRYLEGQSLEQAAEGMNRTKGAVRGLLHRAKEAMREALGRSSKWFHGK